MDNGLYVPGWCFIEWFKKKRVAYICVVYKDKTPIGCGVESDYGLTGVYVDPIYRNSGVGKRIVKHLIKHTNGNFTGRGRKLYNFIKSEQNEQVDS